MEKLTQKKKSTIKQMQEWTGIYGNEKLYVEVLKNASWNVQMAVDMWYQGGYEHRVGKSKVQQVVLEKPKYVD